MEWCKASDLVEGRSVLFLTSDTTGYHSVLSSASYVNFQFIQWTIDWTFLVLLFNLLRFS